MVLALKILLFTLSIACALTVWFIRKEFKTVLVSSEFDDGSIMDKFIIYLMAFGSIILLLSMMVFSFILIFCKITVVFPEITNIIPW